MPGIANPSLETWGWIDINNNYVMNYTNNQFIIRSGTGDKFYKLWIVNYYNQNGTSGNITLYFEEINPCDGCENTTLAINDSIVREKFTLLQNYPNPFNPSTSIKVDIPESDHVKLLVYDIKGRLVSTLFEGLADPGTYEFQWNANDVPSGIYLVNFITSNQKMTQKITLVK